MSFYRSISPKIIVSDSKVATGGGMDIIDAVDQSMKPG